MNQLATSMMSQGMAMAPDNGMLTTSQLMAPENAAMLTTSQLMAPENNAMLTTSQLVGMIDTDQLGNQGAFG